eukprot:g7346.t1
MGAEDLELELESDIELDPGFDDEFVPGDQHEQLQEDEQQQQEGLVIGAKLDELQRADDEDDDVDPANMRWVEEEERDPTPEELWQKISSHVAADSSEPQQPTSTAPPVALQPGTSQQQAASSSSSKAHQPAAGASASSAARAAASSSSGSAAGQQPTRVNTYTHLIHNTNKKTFMIPKEYALIVDENDADWFTKLLDTSKMRLPEVEKELREADSQFHLHTIELEQPIYEVCSQSLRNMIKNNIRADPTSETDKWWAQRAACYFGSLLQTSVRYATHDGESVCSSENPQLYDFIRTLDPVSLQYMHVFRDTLYLFHNSNKEKKKLPRFVSCVLSSKRIISSIPLLQLSFFCLRLRAILQAPCLTESDRKAILQRARLDPVSSLLSRAFKIVVPRGGELSRETLFRKAAQKKHWPRQSRDEQLRNYLLAATMRLRDFNPYGAKAAAAGSLTDVAVESATGATSKAQKRLDKAKVASERKAATAAKKAAAAAAKAEAAATKKAAATEQKLAKAKSSQLAKQSQSSARQSAMATLSASGKGGELNSGGTGTIRTGQQHTLHNILSGGSVQPPPPQKGKGPQMITKSIGKGDQGAAPKAGTIAASSKQEDIFSPLSEFNDASLNNLFSSSAAAKAPSLDAADDPADVNSADGDVAVAAKSATTAAQVINILHEGQQQQQDAQMLSPRSDNFGSQPSDVEMHEAQPPAQQLGQIPNVFTTGTGTHGDPVILSQTQTHGLFAGGGGALAAPTGEGTNSAHAAPTGAENEPAGGIFPKASEAIASAQTSNTSATGAEVPPPGQQQQDTNAGGADILDSAQLDALLEGLPSANGQQQEGQAQQPPGGPVANAPAGPAAQPPGPDVVEPPLQQQNASTGGATPGAAPNPGGAAHQPQQQNTSAGGSTPVAVANPPAATTTSAAMPGASTSPPAAAPGATSNETASLAAAYASAHASAAGTWAQLQQQPNLPGVYIPGASAPIASPSSATDSNSTNNATPTPGQQLPDPLLLAQQQELARLKKALREQEKRTEAERARNAKIQKEMEEKRAADQDAHAAKMKQIEEQMQSNATSFQQMMEKQRNASEDQMEASRRAADQQMTTARQLADQQLAQQRKESEVLAQAQSKEVQAQALAARKAAEQQAKESLERQAQLQAAHQKMQDERGEVFKQKIKKDQDKMNQQRQEAQRQHQEELQRRELEIQKAKEALVTRQQADAVRAQLGGHSPGLTAVNPLQPLAGTAPGGSMGGMFVSGPDGLDLVEAEQQPRSMQQSLDDIVAEGKAKLDALRETLDMQTQEKDLFKKYRAQQEELRKVQQQAAEGQPDGGKYLVENAFAAAALYTNRRADQEEAALDPMFNIKTTLRPDGVKTEDRKTNCENAVQYMELPRSGAHCGGFKPKTESIPAEVMRHVATVGVNPTSDKRWINPQVSRQVIHEVTTYVQKMAAEKVTAGTCTPHEFFSDQFWGIHLRPTIDACLLQFDKDAGDPSSTFFVDFREDLMILVTNDKTSKLSFSAAIEVAAEKGKAPILDMSQMFAPLGFTSKDRLSRTWQKIVYMAVSNDSGLRRVLQCKDRKELSCLRSVLAKLRDDVEAVIGTENPDPARIVKDNAEKLWREFNMRSCVLGLTYTRGRIARMSELQTKNFYDSLDLKLKEEESALVKEMLKKSRTLWLLTLALEYMRENPHGVNAPPTTTVDLVRKWTTWLLAIPNASKEQETYVMQERAKAAKEKAAADKLRQEQRQFLAKKGKGENAQPLKYKNLQHPGKGNQHQPNAGAPGANNKRPGANNNSDGPVPKLQRTGDGTSDRAEKQKAFVEAMRIQFCKKFDVEFDTMKEQTKRNCCIYHLCKLGGIHNNKSVCVECSADPCPKDPNHTHAEEWFRSNKKLRKKPADK